MLNDYFYFFYLVEQLTIFDEQKKFLKIEDYEINYTLYLQILIFILEVL